MATHEASVGGEEARKKKDLGGGEWGQMGREGGLSKRKQNPRNHGQQKRYRIAGAA